VLFSRCLIVEDTIIGARALVTEDVEVPGGSLVLGQPGKVIRSLTQEERTGILESAQRYVRQAAQYSRD
jgi:carbonic anhydrase/acetyltransferase-like protein (isoleucine patch superfamily)